MVVLHLLALVPPSYGTDEGISSGRYVIKKATKPKKQVVKKITIPKKKPERAPADTSGGSLVPEPTLQGLSPVKKFVTGAAPVAPNLETQERGLGSQLRDVVLGGDMESITNYRNFLGAEDVRRNIFELAISPSYIYNDSGSPYAPRSYNTHNPGANLDLDVWLTPFFGFTADYRFSFLADLPSSLTNGDRIKTTNTWTGLGVNFRRFFGISDTSPYLKFSIRYVDFIKTVENSGLRMGLNTTGADIDVTLSIPKTKRLVWNLGFSILPFGFHEEKTSLAAIQSGTSNDTFGVGASIGFNYRLSRRTQFFIKTSTQIFRHRFTGATLSADPITGQNLSTVSVTDAYYFIDVGITFGK